MILPKKVMIVAPFWGNPQHVGCYRIDRFVRWLSEAGIKIVLVRAGNTDGVRETPWGVVLTVRDPLGIYQDSYSEMHSQSTHRPKLLRMAAHLILNPDPTIVWAIRVIRHPEVLEYGKGAKWVLASSPPESVHVASSQLAKRLRADLIVDMRDGWMDEPMKPILHSFFLQRIIEGVIERHILRKANQIIVTSTIWKSFLQNRLSFTSEKVTVLTNAYPHIKGIVNNHKKTNENNLLRLLYAGRITSSRPERRVEHLLKPLFSGLSKKDLRGKITFIGNLSHKEISELMSWDKTFKSIGWQVEIMKPVNRKHLLYIMKKVDGLLLLSISKASIPAKFFDYVFAQKPILTVTPKGSVVWEIGQRIRQMFCIDYQDMNNFDHGIQEFLEYCNDSDSICDLPFEFSEEYLKKIFLSSVFNIFE